MQELSLQFLKPVLDYYELNSKKAPKDGQAAFNLK